MRERSGREARTGRRLRHERASGEKHIRRVQTGGTDPQEHACGLPTEGHLLAPRLSQGADGKTCDRQTNSATSKRHKLLWLLLMLT